MKLVHLLVLVAFFATCQGFVGNLGLMMRREMPSTSKELVTFHYSMVHKAILYFQESVDFLVHQVVVHETHEFFAQREALKRKG